MSDVLVYTIQDGPGVSVDVAVRLNVMVRYAYASMITATMTNRVRKRAGRSLARLGFLLHNCRVLQTQLGPLLPDSFCQLLETDIRVLLQVDKGERSSDMWTDPRVWVESARQSEPSGLRARLTPCLEQPIHL